MSLSRLCCLLTVALLCAAGSYPQPNSTDFARWVNPFIGTDGTGHAFPGPALPFGMVQPGPDNRDHGWDYTSGYQYKDSVIMGFSQTRANGTGISEFGDVLLQPLPKFKSTDFAAPYTKRTEKARPGYYSVCFANGIKTELTCTERVALHRYTYPGTNGWLLVDLQHGLRFLTDSLVLDAEVKPENNRVISGYCHTKNWVERTFFFTIEFSMPFDSLTVLPRLAGQRAPRYVLKFSPGSRRQLMAKVALSTVSVAGARRNLQTELSHWNFETVTANARATWNSYLKRIDLAASPRQKEIFYSCLYRLLLQPSNIADCDGQYRGATDQVRHAPGGVYYSTFSLWDTYRAAHPLYTLLVPERVNGFVASMIAHSQAAGFLPIWTAWGKDNYCMIGNHAIPVITDAFCKGFRGFDTLAAFNEILKTTTLDHVNSNWRLLQQFGYYPFDSLDNEAVSRTLEHGVDDYCVAFLAARLGNQSIADLYDKRSKYYKNLFDTASGLFRGRNSLGQWRTPFEPLKATSPMNNPGDYTEANAWQYFWTPAQYDVPGMTELLGGKVAFEAKLDSFFAIPALQANKHLGQEAMIGQYAHGNEPSHHIAYLYGFTAHPAKGQIIVSEICRRFYNNTPDGMIGNDDCGQMSAWYIFATLGFYPVNPASGEYVIGQPQATDILINNGRQSIRITNNKTGMRINNKLITSATIRHQQLVP